MTCRGAARQEGVSHRVWVILTQTLVRVLCGYPSRTRGWANSWYLSWYLRSDPLVVSPLGGVFPVVLVVTSMGFTIFYIIAAIAPASAKLQPRAVRHGFLNVRSDYPTGVATHTLAVASTGPTHNCTIAHLASPFCCSCSLSCTTWSGIRPVHAALGLPMHIAPYQSPPQFSSVVESQ